MLHKGEMEILDASAMGFWNNGSGIWEGFEEQLCFGICGR